MLKKIKFDTLNVSSTCCITWRTTGMGQKLGFERRLTVGIHEFKT